MIAAPIEQLLAVLLPARDILAGRVEAPAVPLWCERRGFSEFLLGLSDAELERAEEQGLLEQTALRGRMPRQLAEWLAAVAEVTRVPRLRSPERAHEAWRSVRERKRAQLAAM